MLFKSVLSSFFVSSIRFDSIRFVYSIHSNIVRRCKNSIPPKRGIFSVVCFFVWEWWTTEGLNSAWKGHCSFIQYLNCLLKIVLKYKKIILTPSTHYCRNKVLEKALCTTMRQFSTRLVLQQLRIHTTSSLPVPSYSIRTNSIHHSL